MNNHVITRMSTSSPKQTEQINVSVAADVDWSVDSKTKSVCVSTKSIKMSVLLPRNQLRESLKFESGLSKKLRTKLINFEVLSITHPKNKKLNDI